MLEELVEVTVRSERPCRGPLTRGSALLFAVVLIAAITITFVSSQELMMTSVRSQARYEARVRTGYANESAVASVLSELRHGIITVPATRNITVDGVAVSATVEDNSGTMPRTVKITSTATLRDRTYSTVAYRGYRITPRPWNYALFVSSNQLWNEALTTGSLGANGDCYFTQSVTGSIYTHPINGDLECAGTVSANFAVTGTTWAGAPSIPFPTVSWNNYLGAQDTSYAASSINGFTFTDFGPTKTHLVYREGGLTISGNFIGNGVIFVHGNADITGTVTASGGKLVVLVDGDINLNTAAISVSAFLYCTGRVNFQKSSTVTGAVVASDFQIVKPTTIVYDPYFWDNPTERARFKLPGNWP